VEARQAKLRVPVAEAAAAPPKPFDTVPMNPADGITMRQAAAADQVGFAGEYASLLEQTDVFRKPFPGDPMLNQMLEKHFSPMLPRPLKPRCVLSVVPSASPVRRWTVSVYTYRVPPKGKFLFL
jgi:hypothetical protein